MSDDDDRIRAYLRSRGDVAVPDDLAWPDTASEPGRQPGRLAGVRARMAVGGLVAVVVLAAFLGLPGVIGPAQPSGSPAGVSAAPSGQAPDSSFPSDVAGLPVVSVATADALLRAGKLDGQAVAVAGYYDAFIATCPYPGRYIGPLERWCDTYVLTDTRAAAQLCHPFGSNGSDCGPPSGTYLAPFFKETSGSLPFAGGSASGVSEPVAVVVIGHAGDPRQWQCTVATQTQCAHAFVVDRVAWTEGHDVELSAPETGDSYTGAPIKPTMTLAQVGNAIGVGDGLLTGAAVQARDVATVDPRWNLAGDAIVWVVRSLAAGSTSGQTRPETVWLVDDASGRVVDSHPLQLDRVYQPARFWQMATVQGLECCSGSVRAFYRVESSDGTTMVDGPVSTGEEGRPGYTVFGGGYGSEPLVLPAGRYSITTWLATVSSGVAGPPRDECSTQVTLGALDDVALNAMFPQGQPCTFGPAPTQTPLP